MSDKLQEFESSLRAEHDALTTAFEESQVKAEAAWAEHEQHSLHLTEFRAKYGRVLRALDQKEQ
jgi:hypothetical protein